ncbi:MAG: DUF2207 domain-containing protein, partial [Spirochaetales bacterium]|nr:DUF2207 domain-containing protein [Spirochaetales bacterium]
FKAIFAQGDYIKISTENLTKTFYKIVQNTKRKIKDNFFETPEKAIYTRKTNLLSIITGILSFLPIISIFAGTILAKTSSPILTVIMTIFAVLVTGYPIISLSSMLNKKTEVDIKKVSVTVILGIIIIAGLGTPLILIGKASIVKYLSAIVSGIAAAVFAGIMSKRTEYGDQILEKTLGFRDFIKNAEQEKLETISESPSSFFYKTLPYAIVFGLTNKWGSHYKNINIQPPKWYSSDRYETFSVAVFSKNIDRNFDSIYKSISSKEGTPKENSTSENLSEDEETHNKKNEY